MSDEEKKVDEGKTGEGKIGGNENYLGSWSSKEEATEGLKNLQSKLSEQGNETGTLRKQVENSEITMKEMQEKLQVAEKAGAQKASDRDAEGVKSEQAKINKAIEALDPVDEGYQGAARQNHGGCYRGIQGGT
jgi:chromosome segregation ATPase